MSKTITLTFDGYYKEKELPPKNHERSGIYLVYAGAMHRHNLQLLYIGESKDVAHRPCTTHEKYQSWQSQLAPGEILYFSFADVDTADRERAEAALIYRIQPPCNEQCTGCFNHEETLILCHDAHIGIPNVLIVP